MPTHLTSRPVLLAFALALAAGALAAPGSASARPAAASGHRAAAAKKPTAKDIAQAKADFMRGQKLFNAGNYKDAIKLFKASYRLSRNAILLYNIGWTHDKLHDTDLALFYYKMFLRDAPKSAPNRSLARRRVRALTKQINSPAASEPKTQTKGRDATKPAPPQPRTKPTGAAAAPSAATSRLQHTPVFEAPAGKALHLTAAVPNGTPAQVTLYYRGENDSTFTAVPMRAQGGHLVASIPASAMRGRGMQYYIEAKRKGGAIIGRSGRSTDPNVVMIKGGAAQADDDAIPDASGSGASGLPGPAGGGILDAGSHKFEIAKWSATGGAIGMLAISVTSYFLAQQAAASLEAEASASRMGMCAGGAPCRAFSDRQRSLQSQGKRWAVINNVTLGVGLAATAVAGYLWYKDVHRGDGEREGHGPAGGLAAAPVVGDHFVGATAAFNF